MRPAVYKLILVIMLSFFVSGCALLQLPFQTLNLAGSILEKLFSLASKLPTPPPGVFF